MTVTDTGWVSFNVGDRADGGVYFDNLDGDTV